MQKVRTLERWMRAAGNHRRIEILDLIDRNPELSVSEISEQLKINFKTGSEHIRRLTIAGFVLKKSQGKSIRHKLTSRGIFILTFLRTLE
ncbi:MAG: helix-turn-helix domain-containing protein [Candidatus Levybacteria bacterium]|nr:helix-turn-helix domain-containing protein [Candidatus Levybacteria bacterium]